MTTRSVAKGNEELKNKYIPIGSDVILTAKYGISNVAAINGIFEFQVMRSI